eukprot:2857-Heterococcus_DN1.PRE.1
MPKAICSACCGHAVMCEQGDACDVVWIAPLKYTLQHTSLYALKRCMLGKPSHSFKARYTSIGNFITDRSTTRVHAPPGGKSSFSLSHPDNVAPPSRVVAPVYNATNSNTDNNRQTQQQTTTSSNSFATGSNQNAASSSVAKGTGLYTCLYKSACDSHCECLSNESCSNA